MLVGIINYHENSSHIAFLVFILVIGACNKPKRLSQDIIQGDSLRSILVAHKSLVKSVNEANLILDSLDGFMDVSQSPNEIRSKETEQKSISTRLQKFLRYVKISEARIAKVESALNKSRNEASAYFLMMDALKDEVRIRDEELQVLSDPIARTNTILSAASLTGFKSLTSTGFQLFGLRISIFRV